MTARKKVQVVIDRVRPLLLADGGDIELVDVADRKAFVRLTGRCASCPSSPLTLHLGVERAIRDHWPELDAVVVVPS
jgi:Fe-S cluster biogenesis protein NfuA